jgi:ComF family protein
MLALVQRLARDNKVAMRSFLRPFTATFNFALPARCAGCGTIVAESDQLCLDCWTQLRFLTGGGCIKCHIPMAVEGQICAPCLQHPPSHDGVRAAVAYGPVAREIAIRLKHGRHIGFARLMGRLMARLATNRDALLIPVPLHRWRLWARGFNQSVLIADQIARLTGNTVSKGILIREKATPLLGGLGAADRAKALRGAIKVPPAARAKLRDQAVYLVDDVYTSGATANAAARALKRAGAARVDILCWARVLRDDGIGN